MKTQEILTIIGLSCLGLCLLLCLLKMSMKDKNGQANCDKSCGMLFFAAAVLIGVSQLLKETSEPYHCHAGASPATGKVSASGQPCSPGTCISDTPGSPPNGDGSMCPPDLTGLLYETCYTPNWNGCAGPGGGGSKCSPPPGTLTLESGAGSTTGPLIAARNQTCSNALKLAHSKNYSGNCTFDKGTKGDESYPWPIDDQDPNLTPGCREIGGVLVQQNENQGGGVGYCHTPPTPGNPSGGRCSITTHH
jgi:hypothetical protein